MARLVNFGYYLPNLHFTDYCNRIYQLLLDSNGLLLAGVFVADFEWCDDLSVLMICSATLILVGYGGSLRRALINYSFPSFQPLYLPYP